MSVIDPLLPFGVPLESGFSVDSRKRMKTTDWAKWAAVAEILSGIAVVVTLVFLVFEVRGNTNVVRATAFERNIRPMSDFRLMLAQDADLAELNQASLSPDGYSALSAADQLAARHLSASIFLNYENAYYARKYELLGEDEYQRFIFFACFNLGRFGNEMRSGVVAPLTSEYIEHLAEAPECEDVRDWLLSLDTTGR